MRQVVVGREADPLVAHVGRERLRLFDIPREQVFVDAAMVHVSKRHPATRGTAR